MALAKYKGDPHDNVYDSSSDQLITIAPSSKFKIVRNKLQKKRNKVPVQAEGLVAWDSTNGAQTNFM